MLAESPVARARTGVHPVGVENAHRTQSSLTTAAQVGAEIVYPGTLIS